MAEARPGDLLVFDSASSPSGRHIGIYVGDGQMLAAPRAGQGRDGHAGLGRRRGDPPRRARRARRLGGPPLPRRRRPRRGRPGPRPARTSRRSSPAATARYGLPEGLLAAVAQRESGLRADAVSPAGARGLMQLMPGTARELGVDPMDPAQAVDGAARYLRRQLDAFGSLDLALAAYNAGPGDVRRHGGIPPYAETRAYVTAVTAAVQTGRAA